MTPEEREIHTKLPGPMFNVHILHFGPVQMTGSPNYLSMLHPSWRPHNVFTLWALLSSRRTTHEAAEVSGADPFRVRPGLEQHAWRFPPGGKLRDERHG